MELNTRDIYIYILTFDYYREGYPSMPYSIASLIASIKGNPELKNIIVGHESINLSELHKTHCNDACKIEMAVFHKVKKVVIDKCWDANFLGIGITAWNEVYLKKLLPFLVNNFKGKLIAGGYEVTAIDDETIKKDYPGFHYYIKGYSETAIINILTDKYPLCDKPLVVSDKIDKKHLLSPYLTGTLPLIKKIHWETKRGCPYRCGFCEWGNASQKQVTYLPRERLLEEIDLFRKGKVDEINILDGTFNFGITEEYSYVSILEKVLSETYAHISIQARFEQIKSDKLSKRFIELCSKYRKRITLEFGLQTIHVSEMDVIGRKNDIEHICKVMRLLNKQQIDFEISIIYGIPGQTPRTFIATIEFILNNKCEKIFAYPLRIPRNSKMEKEKELLGVHEEYNVFNVKSAVSSFSFNKEDYKEMNQFSEGLHLLDKERSLKSPDVELVFLIMQITPQNNIKLIRIEKEFRLKFTPPNEIIRSKVQGNEYKILQLAATKEINYLARLRNMRGRQWVPHAFKAIMKVLSSVWVWSYNDIDGKEYNCFIRISAKGNIYVFKHHLPIYIK